MRAISAEIPRQRCAIRIRGRVQGVGFRPAMCRLAGLLGLGGFVHNDGEGVFIEIEGGGDSIARFLQDLPSAAPPFAQIEAIESAMIAARGDAAFAIAKSVGACGAGAEIPPDVGPCSDCLAELCDDNDRRRRYPFINCTACGPRFSIVRSTPYDRQRTTMDAFALCPACQNEYEDPGNRRFHAEPNACPRCGPQLRFVVNGNDGERGPAALAAAVALLGTGGIVAVKGVGGFLLAADAAQGDAVLRLRRRKHRPDKPFAVLARDLAHIEAVAEVDAIARTALTSPARPIVLCRARPVSRLAPAIAPGLDEIGFFLPPTPLQHLLVADGPPLQVMTSGNRSEEPIAKDDADAFERLGPLVDAFLVHDRAIHTRVDDSVVRVTAGASRLVRRARGYVPGSLPLPVAGPAILAVGAQMKATVTLTHGGRAVISQHLGDLDDLDSYRFFEEAIEKLEALLGVAPAAIAHDLHPDYRSTRWAIEAAHARGLPRVPVQHHHAHVAACLAEHRRAGPALGVAFDGTGLGSNGTLWGGEFLEADLRHCVRRGHLRPLALAGGEAAIREPWRLALAALLDAGAPTASLGEIPAVKRAAVERLLAQTPPVRSSAAGRWFDAVAALCGLGRDVSYDGQAPAELEALAAPSAHGSYPFVLRDEAAGFEVDLRPTVRAIAAACAADVPPALIAARFHDTMAEVIVAACRRARAAGAPRLVALAGGCFVNRRLTERTAALLEADNFEVLLPQAVPAGDGGISFGQAAIASAQLARQEEALPCV